MNMGVDGCWCALWSSKPARGVRSVLGGFDSHILPPLNISHFCGFFVFCLAAILISISGVRAIYANVNAQNRLETIRKNSRLNFVSVDDFRTFIAEKEVTDLGYDVEKDIFTGTLSDEAKVKYGITGSGRVAIGNVSKLVEENQVKNDVIMETINNAENLFIKKPTSSFASTVITVIISSVVYLKIVRPIINYTNPNSSTSNKIKVPKGVLLFGPPGTGKTMIAKAMANEVGIPFIATGGSDFVEKYVGVGAKRVREIFAEAKKNEKAIIYIDEIDAIGKKRGSESDNDERINTLNALLIEMDGFKDSSGIMVIASTNRLDMLDDALLRPVVLTSI